jgi:hypothetical protein
MAIVSAFDLSGAPIGKWSSSTSLVRKRSPVRIRAWAPSSSLRLDFVLVLRLLEGTGRKTGNEGETERNLPQ